MTCKQKVGNEMSASAWKCPLLDDRAREIRQASRTVILAAMALSLGAAALENDPPASPLYAADGVAALSGQIVDETGQGLPEVELILGASRTRSDGQGRFLLTYIAPGKGVLQIDGQHAGVTHHADYGFYEVRVETKPGKTTVLPYKNWLTLVDHAHEVVLGTMTRLPIVVTTPSLPGLELHIPAGTVIRDVDGKIVRSVSIQTMPKNHTPYPLPRNFDLPLFYMIQPGGACLYDKAGGVGTAQLYYPNSLNELPKARATFWRYEPDANGWRAQGTGTVSADGTQVVPDAETVITDFGSAECDPSTRTRQRPLERLDVRGLGKLSK